MATKTQIGAVISVEGAKAYENEMKRLTQYTKQFAAETEALTSSFDKNIKSIDDVNKHRESLAKQIDAVKVKLEYQNSELEKARRTMESGIPVTKEMATGYSELQTDLAKTTTEYNNLKREMDELPADNFIGNISLIKDALKNNNSELKQWSDLLKDAGTYMTRHFTVPIVAGFAASVKSYTDWETAITGVKKTTGMVGDELESLESGLKGMALETSFSSRELANIAQIAGQLGIRGVDNILEFTRVVSDLALSTDLSSDEAATALARIFNITEGGVNENTLDKFEKIADVIVHLGNNTATTEPEIVAMANRMASAAHTAGLTTEEIFALSAALSSVGITAEAGGSTIGQALSKLDIEVANWSKNGEGNLERIAEIAKMSAEDFAYAWEHEPVRAFEAFVTGLGNLEESEENINIILDELGMAGIRESNMLKALAEAQAEGVDSSHIFSKALELMRQAYEGVNEEGEEFNALQQESDAAKETAAVKFEQLKESVIQLADAFGEEIVPVLIPFIEGLTDVIKKFGEMDDETKHNIIGFLGFVALAGPILKFASLVTGGIDTVNTIMEVLTGKTGEAAGSTSLLKEGFDLLKGKTGELAKSIADKGGLLEVLGSPTSSVGLIGCLGLLVGAFFGADAAARKMDQKMYESAEACEYVAKRYHWTEEQVNEYGYTWDANGHLIELTNQKIYDSTAETSLDVMNEMWKARQEAKQTTEGAMSDVTSGIENRIPEVQSTSHKMVYTAVEEMRSSASEASSYGQSLGNNFANGISATINNVRNAVHGIARTVQSYLHFSEPDVGPLSNFNSWMPDMMHQMAKGITDNMYLVENAMNGLTGGMANQMGGTTYSYGGVNIILNVPQGANGYQLVDEIESALAQRTVRRKAVFA